MYPCAVDLLWFQWGSGSGISSHLFFFFGSFLLNWIRIRIQPTKINADPGGFRIHNTTESSINYLPYWSTRLRDDVFKYRHGIRNFVGQFLHFFVKFIQTPGDVLKQELWVIKQNIIFFLSILRASPAFWNRFRRKLNLWMNTGTNNSKCVGTNESGLGPSLVSVRTVMFIPDPDPDFLPIPDPGSRGQKGTGSRIRIRNTDSKLSQCAWIPVLITVNGFFMPNRTDESGLGSSLVSVWTDDVTGLGTTSSRGSSFQVLHIRQGHLHHTHIHITG